MNQLYKIATACALALFPFLLSQAQITCSPGGNLFVYTNYDGGVLNINVDVNIPNIKIGVCTYEPTTINISGAFAGNVTEVRYAGYVSTNNHHCSNSPSTTTITGVPSNITSVNFLPPSTLSNPNGYSSIVCAYSCGTTSSQGGCNTADQIKDYFQQTTGGVLTSYFTQYGCFSTSPYLLSTGGNCCSAVVQCNIVANAGQDQSVCMGDTAFLMGTSTGGATTFSWTPAASLSTPNMSTTYATPTSTTSYIFTASDNGVCPSSDTVLVTVVMPNVSIGAFQDVCLNSGPVSLNSGQPSGGFYYGTGVMNGFFDPNIAGVGTSTITYSAVDGNGCRGEANADITVHDVPAVSFQPIGNFCQNDPSLNLTQGSPIGGQYSGPGVSASMFDPSSAGVGSHTLEYQYSDSFCSNTASIQVVVNPNPVTPVLSYSAPNLNSSVSGDSIQWFFNGNYLTTAAGSSIVPTSDGNYAAVVWENGCPSDTSNLLDVVLVGIESNEIASAFRAWPNPASRILNLESLGYEFDAALFDANGKLVRKTQSNQGAGSINLDGLSIGVYLLRIEAENSVFAIKIQKD